VEDTTFTLEEIKQGYDELHRNVECLTCARLLAYVKDLLSLLPQLSSSELARRIQERAVEIRKAGNDSGNERDQQFIEGGISALEVLADDIEDGTFPVSSSERRCGECGHSEGTGADGFCQHFEVKSRNSGSRCLCKCVFPATGVLAQARHRVDVKANVDWLKANAQNFAGEWVAIRSGVLLDVDKSHSALLKRIGPTKGTDILVTWAYDPATGATTEHEEAVRDHGTDTNFPLSETLKHLVAWMRHLHDSHECDCHGWEQRSFLVEAAERYQREIATTGADEAEQQLTEVAAHAYVDGFDAAAAPATTHEGPQSNLERHAYQEHPHYPNYCAFAVGDEDYCKREPDSEIHLSDDIDQHGRRIPFVAPAAAPPPWIDAHGHAWERRHGVECVECPDCGFTFAAMHEDGDGSGYSCPNCGTGETAPAGVEGGAVAWLLPQLKRRLQTVLDCENSMCTHCCEVLAGDLAPMIDRAIELCATPAPAESEEAEPLNGSEDSWMTL
jgi:hypothetical protein